MSWTIILENENGEIISSLEKEFFHEAIFDKTKNQSFKLIKYLDPYGDTIFNNLQMLDLISDLDTLVNLGYDVEVYDALLLLVQQCRANPHSYLKFYGD